MEETKERDLDLRSRKSDWRHKRDPRTWAGKRRENKESGLRINGPGQVRDHADVLKQPRDVEMQQQRRHHETESKNRTTNLDRERSEPKTISEEEERIKSGYQVRPGERICQSYRETGLCDGGSNCIFNHPTCKFFRRGFCKDGSDCKFIHAKNRESPRIPNSTMRQALSSNVKILAEFSHPKEWDGAAEPMPQAHDDPQEQRDHTDSQRYFEMGKRDAQEIVQQKDQVAEMVQIGIVQQHRERVITESQRYFEMGRRDAQEIVRRHRQREASDRQTIKSQQERRQRDITECQRCIEMGRRDVQEIVKQHRQGETSEAEEQRLMATTDDRKFDERKHQTVSSSMAAKRAELMRSLQSVFKDDIAAGCKRMGIEHGEGCQRVGAEEIVQEQSTRQKQ